VNFIAGGWQDAAGNPNLAEAEMFSVIPAPMEVQAELRVVAEMNDGDHMSDATFDSYASISSVAVGVSYYVEIWLRDTGNVLSGITSGTVDVSFSAGSVNADSLGHGDVYVLLPSASLDNAAGLVTNLGGGTSAVGAGAGGWVRLGSVEVHGLSTGPVTFALGPGDMAFSQVGAGNIAWDRIGLPLSPVTVQQTPSKVDVYLVPRVDKTTSDTSATEPTPDRDPFWQREDNALPHTPHTPDNGEYWVEVWVRSDQANPAAISGGSVNVTFDPQYGEALAVEHGSVFNVLPVDNINNTTGVVSIGGGTLATDMGDNEYVCLGRIQFRGKAPVNEVTHQEGPYDMALDVTDGPSAFALVGGGNVDADLQPVPGVDIRAMIYDIDDSGLVDFGDFSYFVPAFMHTVGEPEAPYIWWADFDRSGMVDFGDLSYFATAFLKPFCDPTISFPTWWGSTYVTRTRGASAVRLAGAPSVGSVCPETVQEGQRVDVLASVSRTGQVPDVAVAAEKDQETLELVGSVLGVGEHLLPDWRAFAGAMLRGAPGAAGWTATVPHVRARRGSAVSSLPTITLAVDAIDVAAMLAIDLTAGGG